MTAAVGMYESPWAYGRVAPIGKAHRGLLLIVLFFASCASCLAHFDVKGDVAMERKMDIAVNGHVFTADMEDNSSVDALFELLKKGPVTVMMEDYAGMEKVGDLGVALPRNDMRLDTEAGDVVLYRGRSLVIYYDRNSWSLTPLGRITGTSAGMLESVLGPGTVEATLSIGG